jgi:hypothetical protein
MQISAWQFIFQAFCDRLVSLPEQAEGLWGLQNEPPELPTIENNACENCSESQ